MKISVKQIVSATLTICIVLLLFSAVAAFKGNSTRNISPLSFSLGAVDSSGKDIKSEKSIYTDEMFECQGLVITPDFSSDVSFEVFYYYEDGSYCGSTGKLSSLYEKNDFELAKYAKVVLYSSKELSFLEVYEFARSVSITVNKDQTFDFSTLQLFPGIEEEYSNFLKVGGVSHTLDLNQSSFRLLGSNSIFEGKRICKIGLPIGLVKDVSKDSKFTLAKMNTRTDSVVEEYVIYLSANSCSSSEKVDRNDLLNESYSSDYLGWNKVDEWVYFSCDITCSKYETLILCSVHDDIVPVCVDLDVSNGYPYSTGLVLSNGIGCGNLFVDFWYVE